jgi:hypothetical protein
MRENTGSGYHFHRIDIICETRQCFAAVFLRKIITAKKSSLNAVFMVIAHSIFNYDTLSGAIVVYERQSWFFARYSLMIHQTAPSSILIQFFPKT